MKVLYTAGPYRNESLREITLNIQRAETIALELWQMGFAVICPHKNTAYFEGALTDHIIIGGDLELVSRVDGVVMLPGWQKSIGANMEMRHARDNNKPIFFWESAHDRNCLREWQDDEYDIEKHLEDQAKMEDISPLLRAC